MKINFFHGISEKTPFRIIVLITRMVNSMYHTIILKSHQLNLKNSKIWKKIFSGFRTKTLIRNPRITHQIIHKHRDLI